MKPIVQALLVADHVYTDRATGKKVVAGIFHRLQIGKAATEIRHEGDAAKAAISVPAGGLKAGSPFCYVSLTEVRGRQRFELRYVDLSEDKAVFGTHFELECRNPLETVELVFPLPMLPANKAGTFSLELLWNNEPLGYHRIMVVEAKEQAEGS